MNLTISSSENAAVMERVLLAGDLSKLDAKDRLFYYQRVCESVGLNPLTRPLDYLTLNGKMVLYAKRDATDQLRKIHGVSVTIKARENIEGVYVVTANARDKAGREDESTGAVAITGIKGDQLANALMKAETKAKRRVTLSICGLGMLDETEIEPIPHAQVGPETGPVADSDGVPNGSEFVPSGKHKGKKWEEVAHDYLAWAVKSDKAPAHLKAGCQTEIDRRAKVFTDGIDNEGEIPYGPEDVPASSD